MTSSDPGTSPIVVACASDRRYALPLAVMLNSLGTHAAPGVRIDAYVLDDGVPAEDKRRVAASLTDNIRLEWRRPISLWDNLPTWGRMPLTTYQKLTLDEWLPAGLDRAVWLDCDLLVLEDLSPLWRGEMGDALIMAVQDQRVPVVSSRFGVTAWREMGLPAEAKYFNAGVLVVDLDRWRRHEVSRRCLDYLRTNADRLMFWDQEAMNAVLAGRWVELDPKWNRHPSLDYLDGFGHANRRRHTGSSTSSEGGILHFSGNLKPWSFAGNGPSRSLYRTYQDRTAWAGWRPTSRWYDGPLGWYETSRLRRLLHPTERFATVALRDLTRRRSDMRPQGVEHG